jgi:hypothetical protein
MEASKVEPAEPRREVDLSPAAIRQRLDEVAQLYTLGMYLAQAKPVRPSQKPAAASSPRSSTGLLPGGRSP